MLTEMVKVQIIGIKDAFSQTFDALYSFGKLQFEDLRPKIESGELPVRSMVLPKGSEAQHDQLTEFAQRARALCEALGLDENNHVEQSKENALLTTSMDKLLESTGTYLDDLESQVSALVQERDDAQTDLAELEKYKPIMTKVVPVVEQLNGGDFEDPDSIALLFEEKYASIFSALEEKLQELSDENTQVVAASESDDGIIPVVIVFERKYSKPVRAYLKEEQVSQIKLPKELEDVELTEIPDLLAERTDAATKEIDKASEALANLAKDQQKRLAAYKDAIDDRIEELDVLVQFGETTYTFLIEGYVPRRDFEDLKKAIPTANGTVVVEGRAVEPREYPDVPVEIEPRKGILKNFRSALGLWGSPEYGTLDPTLILAISFPIIFGMIVGDAGYGLLMVIGCLLLRHKFKNILGVQNITGVLMPAGISSIIFGIFYFEFFGNLAHEYIPGLKNIHPIKLGSSFSFPFLRTESNMMTTLLFMAVGFGVLEVIIGLILGIVNSKKTGETKHIFEKTGILMIFFSALLLVVTMMMPALTTALGALGASIVKYVAYLLLAVGLISTLFGGGIMGAIEVLESISHAASYIRIMAVGLVGALLADAANDLAFHTLPNIGGIAIAVVLHLLNFAIICFSPSIHALRLNFLEFFDKFFERGTREYKPFARAGKEGKL